MEEEEGVEEVFAVYNLRVNILYMFLFMLVSSFIENVICELIVFF